MELLKKYSDGDQPISVQSVLSVNKRAMMALKRVKGKLIVQMRPGSLTFEHMPLRFELIIKM